jgi:nucleoside-diphosphate-sugar epimerase
MNVLVTGATGKVGSRLVPSLLGAGHSVRILVRRTDDETLRKLEAKGAETFIGDIMQPESLQGALDGVDAIVHLAAFFRSLRSEDAEKIKSINETGTKNIAEAASQINTGIRFVFSSTSTVYSNEAGPALESDPVSPAAAYPSSKVASEKLLLGMHAAKQLDVRILRFVFVYGAGDPHLPDSISLFERWNRHPAYRLHMVHHLDIAQAVKLAMGVSAMGGEIYNVADDSPITLQEIVQLTGQTAKLADPATPLTNAWSGLVSAQKIRSLGFRPLVPSYYAASDLNIL